VLVVSINPGGPAGGSGTQWFVGDFDGSTFTPFDSEPAVRWLDRGADCYAAVTFNDVPDGRRVLIGWMSNWDYARDVPTESWRGAMTIPRELSLRSVDGELQLCSAPVAELRELRDSPLVDLSDVDVAGVMEVSCSGAALDIELVLAPISGVCGLDVRIGDDERTRIGYDLDTGALFIDRTRAHTGVSQGLNGIQSAAVQLEAGAIRLRVIIDSCSVEVFAQGGLYVLTDLIFPSANSVGMALFSEGSAQCRSLMAWSIDAV
jgi:fructan beta-fructosidase